MTVFLTWDAVYGEPLKVPDETSKLRAVVARRPSDAARASALRASVPRNPFDIVVGVVRADRLGDWRPDCRKYHVIFNRSIRSVKVSK